MKIEKKVVSELVLGTRVSIRFSYLQRIAIYAIPTASTKIGFVNFNLYDSENAVNSYKTISVNKASTVWLLI